MTSTPTGETFLLVHRVLSLHYFLQYSIPQNLVVASKVKTLAMESVLSSQGCLLHLQA